MRDNEAPTRDCGVLPAGWCRVWGPLRGPPTRACGLRCSRPSGQTICNQRGPGPVHVQCKGSHVHAVSGQTREHHYVLASHAAVRRPGGKGSWQPPQPRASQVPRSGVRTCHGRLASRPEPPRHLRVVLADVVATNGRRELPSADRCDLFPELASSGMLARSKGPQALRLLLAHATRRVLGTHPLTYASKSISRAAQTAWSGRSIEEPYHDHQR